MDKKLTITERRNLMLKEGPLTIPSSIVSAGKKFKDIANTPERTLASGIKSAKSAYEKIPRNSGLEQAQGYTSAVGAGKDFSSLASRALEQTPKVRAFRDVLSTKVTPATAMIGGEFDARRRLQNISTSKTPTLDKVQAGISRVSGLAPTVGAVVGNAPGAAVGSAIGLAGAGANALIDKYKDDKAKQAELSNMSHMQGYGQFKGTQQSTSTSDRSTAATGGTQRYSEWGKKGSVGAPNFNKPLSEENNIKALKYAIRLMKKKKHHNLYKAYPQIVAGGLLGDLMGQHKPGIGTAVTALSMPIGTVANLIGKQRLIKKRLDKDKKKKLKEETLSEARIKLIKARIRGGKIQRRKKVSNVPGMTLRGGKLKRMSPTERRNRRMGQRRGKIKRKAKLTRTLQKRRRSLQKRKMLGLG